MTDLLIQNAKLASHDKPVHICIEGATITAIHDAQSHEAQAITASATYDAQGHFVCSGFFDSHVHLDKACILDRCRIEQGDLHEAVEETGQAKKEFTEADVFARASRVIEMAIKKGTVGLRTFVETDEKTALRSFYAIQRAKRHYAFAIDIQICAFAQSGLTTKPTTQTLLTQALTQGADLIGGCPYKDDNPDQHIEMVFDLAEQFDVDVDFHLDFDLDPSGSSIPKVVKETLKRGYQGRVSIGHVTKLSAMDSARREYMAALLKSANITLIVLPATDLFLNGREFETLIPRGMVNANELTEMGITTTIASNNILNAFTPYGDASLVRMANMYANVAQLAKDAEISAAFDMVSKNAAALLSQQTTISVGAPATLVVLEADDAIHAIRTNAQALAGFKHGQQTFANQAAYICHTTPDTSPS